MANLTTVTRPYARAILALAQESNSYAQWTKMLQYLTVVINYPAINAYVRNLAVGSEAKAELINSIDPSMLDQQGQNLIKLLAHYKRLLIIPELYRIYEQLRQATEREVTVHLILAKEISQLELQRITDDFAKELKATLKLTSKVNPDLIGGGLVRIGDRVLDASIKNDLKALYQHLTL